MFITTIDNTIVYGISSLHISFVYVLYIGQKITYKLLFQRKDGVDKAPIRIRETGVIKGLSELGYTIKTVIHYLIDGIFIIYIYIYIYIYICF